MVNFVFAVLGAIIFGIIFGGAFAYWIWYVFNKLMDKKEKRNIPINEIKEQLFNTKPDKDERRLEENERERINKYRQFEKLRRGESKTESFYSRKFEDERRSNIQNGFNRESKQSGLSNESNKRDIKKLEWY